MPATAATDAVIDGIDIDAVVTAVRGCPGVQDLDGGPPQLTATYLPGRRVAGVRVEPLAVAVQVRARWGVRASELSTQIRTALAPMVGGRRIDIMWVDVADRPSWAPASAATAGADGGTDE